jgi:hypothetical protein
MRELEELDQRLKLARLGLSPKEDARARVRGRLAARGAVSAAGTLAKPKHGVPVLVSAALIGLSFVAGYWLRDVQVTELERVVPDVVEPAPSPSQRSLAPAPPSTVTPPLPAGTLPAGTLPAGTSSAGTLTPTTLSGASGPVAVLPAPTPVSTPRVEPRYARLAATEQRLDERSGSERSSSQPPARHPAAAPAAPTTSSELELLRRAERALRAGDPALALLLLDQLERAYPTSALREERTAALILVECARSGELARPEAARFVEKHPSSVYSDRILRDCQLGASRSTESSADAPSDGH